MRRLVKRNWLLLFYFFSVFGLVSLSLRCSGGGGGGSSGGTAATTNTSRDLPGASTATISARNGGTLQTATGISLEIPAGALSQDTKVTIIPLKVDDISDLFINAVRFEPEATLLKSAAVVRFPLPATWDGRESPEIYLFSGTDPQQAVPTGTYAKVTGTAGAYTAEVPIKDFDPPALAQPATAQPHNCHAGTIDRVVGKLLDRGCLRQYIDYSLADNYGIPYTFPFSYPAVPGSSGPEQIQALFDTFFNEIGHWNGIDGNPEKPTDWTTFQDVPPAVVNQILQNVAQDGRMVGLAFKDGSWGGRDKDNLNFYDTRSTEYRHSAVLQSDQNKHIQIVNTSPTKDLSLLNVAYGEFKKAGEVTYPYPAEKLNDFRKLRTSEALEIYLCGSLGCLEDQSKNAWRIEPYKSSPHDRRAIPWSAALIYVERFQELKGRVQLTAGTPAKSWDFTACCPMGGILDGGPEIGGFTRPIPGVLDNLLVILLNQNKISGPGNYTTIGKLSNGDDAEIVFSSDNFTDQCGNRVTFDATSGNLSLDAYATRLKGQNKGSFSLQIKGTLVTCLDANWKCTNPSCYSLKSTNVTGTIDGNFDVNLLFYDIPQENRAGEILKNQKWK